MRVLIVKVSSLGDIIHTLPAVTDARQANKDLVFDWVVEEAFAEIPGWHPAVDRVIPVAIRRWRRNMVKTWLNHEIRSFKRSLQRVHYDLVIDAQGLIKSGIISRLSRGLTIGLSNTTIREPMATLFYNKRYSVPWNEHAVDRVRQLFSRSLQYSYDKDVVNYGIDVENILGEKKVDLRKQLLFLHGTTWGTKHWPEKYWRQLAHIVAAEGYLVLLPWGSADERRRAEYIAAGNEAITVLERQSLTSLARHMLASEGVIAVDTGLGHLAAALDRPTLSIYGPTDPGRSGTWGKLQKHLVSDLDCAPCVKKVCSYSGQSKSDEIEGERFLVTPPCFFSNRPEDVWEHYLSLVMQ